ncbi:MAG: hypothetical protein Q9169_005636 [Polycauliona sp. 2 TL-2023]
MARGIKGQRGQGTKSRGRSQRVDDGIINDAYRDMIDEANSSPTQTSDEGRTVKRRRVRGRIVTQNDADSAPTRLSPEGKPLSTASHFIGSSENSTVKPELVHPLQQEQTADKDDSSDESDFAWEEVGLPRDEARLFDGDQEEQEARDELRLDLVLDSNGEGDSTTPAVARKKPLSALERKLRLEVHKTESTQKVLYRRLPKKIVALLNPDEHHSQFRQDESFKAGLKQACAYFWEAFSITARGMSRSHWAEDSDTDPPQPPSDLDLLMHKSDLLDSANKLQGSRDVGAQLFCALLRSAGVETRLVCSLQVLPFIATAKGAIPPKLPVQPRPVIDYTAPTSDNDSSHPIATLETSSTAPSKRPIGATGGLTRFSDPHAPPITSDSVPHPSPRAKPKRFRESPYPVYWLEVFNPHSNKYTPLDALVTHTIGKPSALTPPLSDPLNSLSYAIAFNDDLTAKDVTRRYTQAYNAKILKQRIDLSAPGKAWLNSVLLLFTYRGRRTSAKDDQEDMELAKKEASEPMPRNIQDFKHHPVYALERHLHRNELIHPRHEVGRVSTGTGSKNEGKSEPVFRKKDVLTCRTADQWFRVGKEIKPGEQPLKRLFPTASSSKRARRSPTPNQDDSDGEKGIKSLYAPHQTKLYVPPPIPASGAPIPRNAFRNLDVYVPSMVPARGWHSLHPITSVAAKILGIDHVPAVTGFSFTSGGGKGRSKGSATVTGAVVWEGHREAVEATIERLEDLAENEEQERWKAILWSMWRKMIRGLRVRQRVKGYQIEGEDVERVEEDGTEDEDDEMEGEDEEMEDESGGGGGFFPEQDGVEAKPTAGLGRSGGRKMLLDNESEDEDVYVRSETEEDFKKNRRVAVPALQPSRPLGPRPRRMGKRDEGSAREEVEDESSLPDAVDEGGGGFIPEGAEDSGEVLNANDDIGGGFLTDERMTRDTPQPIVSLDTGDRGMRPSEESPIGPVAPDSAMALGRTSDNPGIDIRETAAPPFGNLTEEQLIEARLLEEFYAEGKVDDEMQRSANVESGEDRTEEVRSAQEKAPSSVEKQASDGIGEESEEGDKEEMIEEEDKGSLLSEDPSDAEADPDWLT